MDKTNKMNKSILNSMVSDIIFDASISTSMDYFSDVGDSNWLEITRLDKCKIKYMFNNTKMEISKNYSCPTGINGKIRGMIIGSVESFEIENSNPKLYTLKIKKIDESFIHEYIVKLN